MLARRAGFAGIPITNHLLTRGVAEEKRHGPAISHSTANSALSHRRMMSWRPADPHIFSRQMRLPAGMFP